MAEEIKKINDGFIPIPTGEQVAPRGFNQAQKNDGGFKQNRRPGFGRAGFGKDRPKDEFESKLLDAKE
jgi:hypothetical protein